MKLIQTNTPSSWRTTFRESVQLDYADIPTGEVVEVINDEGQKSKRMVTESRPALGFQTEIGRGKSIQWIPVDDVEETLDTLQYYADNGVDSVAASDDWLSPSESVHETITRVPNKDDEGNVISHDISFRVRMGKGSRSCRVPEADFPEFVKMLKDIKGHIPSAMQEVEAKRAEKERKLAQAKQDSSDND